MVAIPPMEHILKEELSLNHTQTSLLFTIPLIMLVALSIPGGLLADKVGIRRAAGTGAIIMTVGCLLRGTATDFSSLLIHTFIYGMGFGLVFLESLGEQIGVETSAISAVIHLTSLLMQRDYRAEGERTMTSLGLSGRSAEELTLLLT